MSDINAVQSSPGTTPIAAGSKQAAIASSGNFMDLILARLAAAAENGAALGKTDTVKTALKTDNSKPQQGQNPLAALQVALASQNMDGEGNLLLTVGTDGTQKIQHQLDITTQIINQLKNILPDSAEKDGLFSKILSKLQTKSDTLQASLQTLEGGVLTKDTAVDDIPQPLLIALGLKPSEIAQASQKIKALEEKLGRDITVEDLIAGVGGIVPPAPQNGVITADSLQSPQAVVPASTDNKNIPAINDGTEPTDDLAAQLNAINVGGDGKESKKSTGKRGFEGLPLKEEAPAGTPIKASGDSKQDAVKTPTHFKDHLVNLINTQKSSQGEMSFPLSFTNTNPDAAILQNFGMTPSASLNLGTTAQAANIIATPATAGMAHPATNMVAAYISKFASNGETQTMNIKLDPPELGNLSIRLQFGKDKSIKAHMTVEKPETFMMLSRDSHALERALNHAGLQTDGSSLTFELAQDNSGFNNNGQDAQDNGFGGGNAGSQDASSVNDMIQSSVTWQIDPSTGHVRYNIFA